MINSFAIVTAPPNELLSHLSYNRCPVILEKRNEEKWLRGTNLGNITSLLYTPPVDNMNAYPIGPKIKNPKNDSKDLIKPVGERVKYLTPAVPITPNTPFRERTRLMETKPNIGEVGV